MKGFFANILSVLVLAIATGVSAQTLTGPRLVAFLRPTTGNNVNSSSLGFYDYYSDGSVGINVTVSLPVGSYRFVATKLNAYSSYSDKNNFLLSCSETNFQFYFAIAAGDIVANNLSNKNFIFTGITGISQLWSTAANRLVGRALFVIPVTDPTDTCFSTTSIGSAVLVGTVGIANNALSTKRYFGVNSVASTSGYTRSVMNSLATAYIYPNTKVNPAASGTVTFQELTRSSATDPMTLQVTVKVTGLTPLTQYGMHVHAFGDLSLSDFTSAGLHFNPFNVLHACIATNDTRHVGDMGNIGTDSTGASTSVFTTNITRIDPDVLEGVLGLAIIIHSGADDCISQPTGASGSRQAAGIIGLSDGTGFVDVTPATTKKGNEAPKVVPFNSGIVAVLTILSLFTLIWI